MGMFFIPEIFVSYITSKIVEIIKIMIKIFGNYNKVFAILYRSYIF